MSRTHRFIFVLLCSAFLLATAGTALAQDTEGQPAPANKDNVEVTHHEDWDVRCSKTNKDQCEMTQLLKSPANDKPIMRVLMGYPAQAEGQPAMIFIVPLGTRLTSGLQIKVDDNKSYRYPFQVCLQQGCRAAFAVDDTLFQQLKSGRTAKVSIVGPKNNTINLDLSLLGFTASSNAISP